jgi:hypothetical protein
LRAKRDKLLPYEMGRFPILVVQFMKREEDLI